MGAEGGGGHNNWGDSRKCTTGARGLLKISIVRISLIDHGSALNSSKAVPLAEKLSNFWRGGGGRNLARQKVTDFSANGKVSIDWHVVKL